MGIAFGNEPGPGATVPYLQVDGSYYWADDGKSPFYNQLVSARNVTKNWRSAERISSSPKAYAYCVDIQYNPGRIPGKEAPSSCTARSAKPPADASPLSGIS